MLNIMNILIILSRILLGLVLVIGFSIAYIACMTLIFIIFMQISIILFSIYLIFNDIIRSLIIIMILGIYD